MRQDFSLIASIGPRISAGVRFPARVESGLYRIAQETLANVRKHAGARNLRVSLQARGDHLWLVIVGVVFAAVSVYYYFRVIQAMYFTDGEATITEEVSKGFKVGIIILAGLIILFGILPQSLLQWFYF